MASHGASLPSKDGTHTEGEGEQSDRATRSSPSLFGRGDKAVDEGTIVQETKFRPDKYRGWVRRQRDKARGPRARLQKALSAWYHRWIIEFLLRQHPLPPTKDGRRIPVRCGRFEPLIDERRGKPYISNWIRTTRYSLLSFFPKQLYFQFSRLANFYFLVIGLLQVLPLQLSTTGKWTTLGPLLVFVGFSMAKEGYEDSRRYAQDKHENQSEAWILDPDQAASVSLETKDGATIRSQEGESRQEAVLSKPSLSAPQKVAVSPIDEADVWKRVHWEQLKVGDVIRLRRNDPIPADIILLHATGPNGIAYIETMALDGETNLKSKNACEPLVERGDIVHQLRTRHIEIVSEDPNVDLYNYDGRVVIADETVPLTMSNVVYRGSVLRNTTQATGLVVNTGEECKIRLNASQSITPKAPSMQSTINGTILCMVLFLALMTAGCIIGNAVWKKNHLPGAWYLHGVEVSAAQIVVGYIIMFHTLVPLSLYVILEFMKIGQWWLLTGDMELYDAETDTPMVANTSTILENLGQVSYVFSDKTGTLTENKMHFRKISVGGVAWLHSTDRIADEAEPKRFCGKGKGRDNDAKRQLRGNQPTDEKVPGTPDDHIAMGMPKMSFSDSIAESRANFERPKPLSATEELVDYIRQNPNTPFSKKARQFILCIALCHTCLPEVKDDGEIAFQASSPDELALVQAARDLGYILVDRPSQSIVLQLKDEGGDGVTEQYQVLDTIEFSSARKRMSIVIRMPDGRICVFCKGADNVMTGLLKAKDLAKVTRRALDQKKAARKSLEAGRILRRNSTAASTRRTSIGIVRQSSTWSRQNTLRKSSGEGVVTSHSLDRRPSYKKDGRSTRLASVSSVSDPDAEDDNAVDEAAAADEGAVLERCFRDVDQFASEGLRTLLYAYRYIDDDFYNAWHRRYHKATTSVHDRQDRIEALGDEIEVDLELAGVTAIEDKLQAGVPETIDKMRRANIKVWMLTGDKRETATEIARSAGLVQAYSDEIILDATTSDLQKQLLQALEDVTGGTIAHSVAVIDGHTLGVVEEDESMTIIFYDLVSRVDSVICCRASPSQKAKIVKRVRETMPSKITLAIGDGANDIAMIQAAHVGIGISGREGLQAARSADFAIAQFRFLQRLLLVQGRWLYLRTGNYILVTFWKNVVFELTQAQFQGWNGYTGTSLYENWSMTVFNAVFTSLGVLIPGIFEKDLAASTLLAVPELYWYGQQRRAFNVKLYFWWVFLGASEAVIIYMIPYGIYQRVSFMVDNHLFAFGELVFTVVVVFINLKLFIFNTRNKDIITALGLLITIAGWFIWILIISASPLIKVEKRGLYFVRDSFTKTFGKQGVWWLTVLLDLAAVSVFDLTVMVVKRTLFPSGKDIYQDMEQRAKRSAGVIGAAGDEDNLDTPEQCGVKDVDVERGGPVVADTATEKPSRLRAWRRRSGQGHGDQAVEDMPSIQSDERQTPR